MCVEHSLFDVSELFKVLWFREVRVMCQQVDHIRYHVLWQEGQELLWSRRGRTRGVFTSYRRIQKKVTPGVNVHERYVQR